MKITVNDLDVITGHNRQQSRKRSLCEFLNGTAAACSDIMSPHRLASFLAQTMHESGGLNHVKEIWGPTAAQRGYEGRKDLGNTRKGDGMRFMGRCIIQVTGRSNYRALTRWVRQNFNNAPDFEANPDQLATGKWLGVGALWYWINRVPSKYVEAGNHEMVTRRINGGLNGYHDRLRYYDRAALHFLGYGPTDVKRFQADQLLVTDGISGPNTRGAMHKALMALTKVEDREKAKPPKPTPTAKPATKRRRGLLHFFFGG